MLMKRRAHALRIAARGVCVCVSTQITHTRTIIPLKSARRNRQQHRATAAAAVDDVFFCFAMRALAALPVRYALECVCACVRVNV